MALSSAAYWISLILCISIGLVRADDCSSCTFGDSCWAVNEPDGPEDPALVCTCESSACCNLNCELLGRSECATSGPCGDCLGSLSRPADSEYCLPPPTWMYDFDGTLNEASGGPSLQGVGNGQFIDGGYRATTGAVKVTDALTASTLEWSAVIEFDLVGVTSGNWARVLGRNNEEGLYLSTDQGPWRLENYLSNSDSSGMTVVLDTPGRFSFHFVRTDDKLEVYIEQTLAAIFLDHDGLYVPDGDNEFRFFADQGSENARVTLYSLRIWDCVVRPGDTSATCGTGGSGGGGGSACNPNPCLNDGRCTDVSGDAVCACQPGWSGPLCATDSATIEFKAAESEVVWTSHSVSLAASNGDLLVKTDNDTLPLLETIAALMDRIELLEDLTFCDDGQQNRRETGVDCGGPACPAC